ncbi:dihydropteroate synthase [Parvibium lacunae]|uniref:Dihydropteroate synthase n=1 Tax=Parvibium lacunae TaxID=1888893 RepID=A0A368L6L8_9BURK|nr:dihydropteroate synthase [Parvibium lacunae]RCS59305.1 dihydropteroate synthase [Parvibium lacunae]
MQAQQLIQTWQTLSRPLVMGVVNVTPDSFSDGGQFFSPQAALDHAAKLVGDGADILDIGGESSRPGAPAVSEAEELRRVLPVVEGALKLGKPLSVDTTKAAVMRVVSELGVAMLNDISGFQHPDTFAAAVESQCALCVMHMQGAPQTMQADPRYSDVLAEVEGFLLQQAQALEAAGVARERICLDPGFGFGKTLAHNLDLLHGLPRLAALGYPLLIGVSRKSMIGQLTGKPVAQREAGSLAAMLAAVARGARIVRVHDVAATVDALKVWAAIEEPFSGT